MKKKRLDNGLTIYYNPIDNAYSTSIGLYINAGSRGETYKNNGITHFLEHLHFRRLCELSQEELYCQMDKIGATLRASTHKDLLRFYIKFRPKYFDVGLSFFPKIISMYEWTEDEFNAEKLVVINEIYEKFSYFDLHNTMDVFLWKNNSLSMPIIGSVENIEQMTLAEIIEYKKTIFSKDNMALVVTGNISQEMMKSCETILSKLKIPESSINLNCRKLSLSTNRKIDIELIEEKWDCVDMNIAFCINEPINQYQLNILNSILGGGTGAKLQCILRENMGLTSNVYSYLEGYEDVSAIYISLSVRNDIYKCLNTIVDVLNNLKSNITELEMQTNVPYFSDNLWFWLENPEILNLEIGWELFKNHEPHTVEEHIELYKNVTTADLLKLAKSIFIPENTSILLVGDIKGIKQKQVLQIFSRLKTCP